MIEDKILEDIKSRLSVKELLIAEHEELSKEGRIWKALCPFHTDHRPSLTLSDKEPQSFYCFVCQKSGNIFIYLMKKRGFKFVEAVQHCAFLAGVTLPVTQEKEIQAQTQRRSLIEISEFAMNYFQKQLLLATGQPARRYLLDRGVNKEIAQLGDMGYAPHDPGAMNLKAEARKVGINEDMLRKGGLLTEKGAPFYNDRIIFPIRNRLGQLVSFTARLWNREVDNYNPKYKNGSESDVFHKANILYNLYSAAPAIKNLQQVIVVEGVVDALRLAVSGFKNVVALMGTAFTEGHLAELRKVSQSVQIVFCLDGDRAGYEATYSALMLVLEKTPELVDGVRILRLSENIDPDTFIRSDGPEAFRTLLEDDYQEPLNWLWERQLWINKGNRYQSLQETLPLLLGISKPSIRELLVQELASHSGFTVNTIMTEYTKYLAAKDKKGFKVLPKTQAKAFFGLFDKTRIYALEYTLMSVVLKGIPLSLEVSLNGRLIESSDFEETKHIRLYEYCQEARRQKFNLSALEILISSEAPDLLDYFQTIVSDSRNSFTLDMTPEEYEEEIRESTLYALSQLRSAVWGYYYNQAASILDETSDSPVAIAENTESLVSMLNQTNKERQLI